MATAIFAAVVGLTIAYDGEGDDTKTTVLTVACIFVLIALVLALMIAAHLINRRLFVRNANKLIEKKDDKRLTLQRLYRSVMRRTLIAAAASLVVGAVVGVVLGFFTLDVDPTCTPAQNYLYTVFAAVAIAFLIAILIDCVFLVVYSQKAMRIEREIDMEEEANCIDEK